MVAPMSLLAAATTEADQQWLFTPEELNHTPSIIKGMSPKTEMSYRAQAVKRLAGLKDILNLPQLVTGSAAAYVHRFYIRESIQDYEVMPLAAAAFFLGSKVEESPRRLRDVVGATLDLDHNKVTRGAERFTPPEETPEYHEMRKRILFFEEVLLRTLAFDLTVRLPYWPMVRGAKMIWKEERASTGYTVSQVAWCFISDSLPTTVSLIHRPNVIAAAAIVLACAQLEIPLPGRPAPIPVALLELAREEGEEREEEQYWLEVFDVNLDEVKDALERMTAIYTLAVDEFVRKEASRTVADALKSLPAEPEPPFTSRTSETTLDDKPTVDVKPDLDIKPTLDVKPVLPPPSSIAEEATPPKVEPKVEEDVTMAAPDS